MGVNAMCIGSVETEPCVPCAFRAMKCGERAHTTRTHGTFESIDRSLICEAVEELRGYLEHFENLRTFGRNGLHRYNNQDHSMWTAVLATLNLGDGAQHDVWSVNTSGEYLEEQGELAAALSELDLVV